MINQTVTAEETLAGKYSRLESDREIFLSNAEAASKLTIPMLFSRTPGAKRFPSPYQSVGARGLNNLSAKILLALLPANTPFYRFGVDDESMAQLAADAAQAEQINMGFARVERTMQTNIESSLLRPKLSEAVKQLLLSGNALVHIEDLDKIRVFKLTNYVVSRDGSGTMLDTIVKEVVNPRTLKTEIAEACGVDTRDTKTDVELFTGIALDGEHYKIYQEINDKLVPGSEGSYPKDKLPWLPLRFFSVDGESYGRGYIEEYIGDLKSLEGLSKSVVQAAAASAKVLFLIRNGITDKRALAAARNGDFVNGDVNDVGVLQVNKFADMRVAQEAAAKIEQRLELAFLMNTSIQRNGERVTAEEIRLMAQELEDGLGGIYSLLSHELQRPLVSVILAALQKRKVLPQFPKDVMKVSITTGLEALGRGQDALKLQQVASDVIALGPVAQQKVNMGVLLTRLIVARGVDTTGLIKTPEEELAEQQQQMAMEVGKAAGPDLVRGAMGSPQ